MDNEEKYRPNAHRYRSPLEARRTARQEDAPRPVARGREKKKTFKDVIVDNFLSGDIEEIKKAVWNDWIIPGSKNLLEFVVHMWLFRERRDPRVQSRSSGLSRIDYAGRYSEARKREEAIVSEHKKTRQPVLEYNSREQAQDVLNMMRERLDRYNKVTMKELYILSDLENVTDHAMSNWGWYSLAGVEPTQAKDGTWLLAMPKMEEMRNG